MSEELRPCPFCGGEAQVNTWTMHGITESRCFCSNSDCPNSVRTVAFEQWNTRPIEDELRARIAELEADNDQLTAHNDTERQDDKSPNNTQTQTIVYGKWIPVGERLPECEKDVLVFWGKASDGSKIDWFGTAWRNECDDGKWCTDPIVPTHWMPLPEPPIVYGKECEE